MTIPMVYRLVVFTDRYLIFQHFQNAIIFEKWTSVAQLRFCSSLFENSKILSKINGYFNQVKILSCQKKVF